MAWGPKNWEDPQVLKAYLYISPFLSVKYTNKFFFPASTIVAAAAVPLSWSQLGIGQDFFSLSIHTWIIKIHKYIFFTSQHKQQLQGHTSTFNWVDNCKDFFFSLYTHVTRVSLNVSFSIFFTFSTFLSPLTSGPLNFCSHCLSLRIALVVSLSSYCSLWLSLYVFLSLPLFIRTPITFSL